MIDRYIYAVTSKLPKNVRKEIGDEIRELIYDMMEDIHDFNSEEERIYKALEKLGDPDVLANKYRGRERYLIGPNYFNKYIFVMKIVLFSIFIGISISTIIGGISSEDSIGGIIGIYIATLMSALLQGVAWVTGIFALLEYNGVSIDNVIDKEEWNPSELPDVPNKKSTIPKSESIFGIIFSTIFFSLLYFQPQYFGIYYKKNGWVINPIFNLDTFESIKIIILIIFIIGIIKELIKLVIGKWTIKLSVIYSLLTTLTSILLIKIISNDLIWNSDIIQKVEEFIKVPWDRVILIAIIIIVITTVIDILTSLYKGVRYGK